MVVLQRRGVSFLLCMRRHRLSIRLLLLLAVRVTLADFLPGGNGGSMALHIDWSVCVQVFAEGGQW